MSDGAPWRAALAVRLSYVAHWIVGAAEDRPAVKTIRHTPGEHQNALMDALTRALRLAERLPPGKPEDDVRRSFCEFIEAMEAGATRDVRIGRVLRSIARLQKAQAKRDRRLEQADCADTKRFASIVQTEVLPLLAKSGS
jgi:hypothetical protein